MDVPLLIAGGVVVLGASVLGGVTGFGFALVCTPLLLLAGFALQDVVVVNLTISGLTRVVTVVQLRHSVNRRRAAGGPRPSPRAPPPAGRAGAVLQGGWSGAYRC